MTKELKTLKDIRIVLNEKNPEIKQLIDLLDLVDGETHNAIVYSDKDLKQEAIKWIKELEQKLPIEANKTNLITAFKSAGKIEWITDFFNITEEDLK